MATKEEFSFLSKDGKTNIHAVKWIPESGEYRAILQITHGMIEYIERYEEFAQFLTQKGFMVVGHDHLGHGKSIQSEADWGFFCEENPSDTLVADMHQLRERIQKENEGVPYFMLGHSMGSYMLRKYLAFHHENLRGAIIMGTGSVPDNTTKLGLKVCNILAKFCGWHHRSKLLQQLSYSKPYHRYDLTGKDYSNSWLSKNEADVKKYYEDPRCTFLFTVNGYKGLMEAVLFDNQMENVKKVSAKLPLFLVSGADDPVGDLGEGVKRVYNMFKEAGSCDITWKLYENDRHEILNEPDRQRVFEDILAWMMVRIDT